MAGRKTLSFTEVEIQKLFGHEAAEDEDPQRLREYYFKTSVYEQVATELPLRILVGHKGIGKSALFTIAMTDDREAGRLVVLIKPDDIADLATDTSDFLKTIRQWKEGLLSIIARKVLMSIGTDADDATARIKRFGGKLFEFFKDAIVEKTKINLEPAAQMLIDNYFKTGVVHVYVDDLDRGWEGRRSDVIRISALINAARDIVGENKGIRFRVSLRSDVYYLMRTSDESTDKIEGSVIWQSWTNHEIFVLLVKRIESYFGHDINEENLLLRPQSELAFYLDPVFEPKFRGLGKWENAPLYRVLMSLIRKRPRDLVKLCTLAARSARQDQSSLIRTEHFQRIFAEYSQGRVQDTINEFRSELPDIQRLLLNMKPSRQELTAKQGYKYKTDRLLHKLNNISQGGDFRFANGKTASHKELASFLYKINFLTARKEVPGGITRNYFEENRYLSNEFADFGYDWEIHPAYRWALQPDDPRSIFDKLDLSIE